MGIFTTQDIPPKCVLSSNFPKYYWPIINSLLSNRFAKGTGMTLPFSRIHSHISKHFTIETGVMNELYFARFYDEFGGTFYSVTASRYERPWHKAMICSRDCQCLSRDVMFQLSFKLAAYLGCLPGAPSRVLNMCMEWFSLLQYTITWRLYISVIFLLFKSSHFGKFWIHKIRKYAIMAIRVPHVNHCYVSLRESFYVYS